MTDLHFQKITWLALANEALKTRRQGEMVCGGRAGSPSDESEFRGGGEGGS